MTANTTTAGDLRKLSSDIRAHQRRTRRAEQRRAELVRQALADGWTHARIAEVTGLSRGRINQLAHPTGGRDGDSAERVERAKQVRQERDGRPGYEGFPSGPQRRHGGAA